MQSQRILQVPLLREAAEVETFGQPFSVACVNWPADFPFAPSCAGHIGHTSDALVVNFRVSGPDLRAVNLTDDGRSWEDSACECFVQVPESNEYYNFEVNPAGFLVAAHGPDVHHRTSIGPEAFARIRRICRVEGIGPITKPIEFRGGCWKWSVTLVIPWGIIGLKEAPGSLRANFFKCGDKTAHPHFLSWAPIESPAPNFHLPAFFGELRFI